MKTDKLNLKIKPEVLNECLACGSCTSEIDWQCPNPDCPAKESGFESLIAIDTKKNLIF